MRWLPLLPVALAAALVFALGCPLEIGPTADTDGGTDGAATDASGSGSDATATGTSRTVTFDSLDPGDFAQTTIAGVTITPSQYAGTQTILVENEYGEGQDLYFDCGTITIYAPELHNSFTLVFNDDAGTILVGAYDQTGALLTDAPVDTQADRQTVGITAFDGIYNQLVGAVPSGSTRLIARLQIASCYGAVHEIVLD